MYCCNPLFPALSPSVSLLLFLSFICGLLWTEYSGWAAVCFYVSIQVCPLPTALSCVIPDKLLTLGRNYLPPL